MDRLVLIAITDFDGTPPERVLERAERIARAAEPGAVAFQLRDRVRSARDLLALGERLRAIGRAHGQALIVNDRLDLALALGADALHLGEGSVTTRDARRLWGERPVFRACHRIEDVAEQDADGVLLSPVFAPRKGNAPLGTASLERARAALDGAARRTRLYALGGVDAANAAQAIAAGAHGVAAIGAVLGTDDPAPLLRALGVARTGCSP